MNQVEIIQKLYVTYLHRPADPSGLRYYVERLQKSGSDVFSLAREFFGSEESQEIRLGLDEKNFVTHLYRSLFSREPDPEGLLFWTAEIRSKGVPLELLPYLMVEAATGNDLIAVKNKIQSAMNFTMVVDPELKGEHLLANYSGKKDADSGRLFLSKVTHEKETIKDLNDARCFIISRICDPGDVLLVEARKSMQEVQKKAESKSFRVDTFVEPSRFSDEAISLLSGAKWKEKVISYSFSIPWMPIVPLDELESEFIIPPPDTSRYRVKDAFRKISEFANLEFKEVFRNGHINVLFVDLSGEINGVTLYRQEGGYIIPPAIVILDVGFRKWKPFPILPLSDTFSLEANMCSSPVIIYHSLLHSLGLRHPDERNLIWNAEIPKTTLAEKEGRIYTPYLIKSFDSRYEVLLRKDALPESIGFYDAEALMLLYGANRSVRSKNDCYIIDASQKSYRVIWDTGGVDLIDASKLNLDCIVNLEGGTFSSLGLRPPEVWAEELLSQLSVEEKERLRPEILRKLIEYEEAGILYNGIDNFGILGGTFIENLKTGSGNDIVYDNSVDNLIELGDGSDRIFLGKGGFDTVDGGKGHDRVYLPFSKKSFEFCVLPEFSIFVHESFAVKLISVEEVIFPDGVILL